MEEFETGHGDRVTVLHVNYDGTRILTASIDHKVKVWNRDRKTGQRTLVDTFTAHDADIRDAKFLHPTLGSYIGTIGADLKFHLWTEDVSQPFNSGRRFRRINTILSTPRIPFASMDFKTVAHVYTYLALIDRQGLLSIYEPTSPDELKEWTLVDQVHVAHPAPSRGEETSFKVRWDQNPTPLPYINSVSDDDTQLSLVVSSLNDVKLYHSSPNPNAESSAGGSNGSHRLTFHESFRFPTHPALVRDVAWSPFNVRGVDRIATACKDGGVRIFELGVSAAPEYQLQQQAMLPGRNTDTDNSNANGSNINNHPGRAGTPRISAPAQAQSSLTSAITGGRPSLQSSTATTANPPNTQTGTSTPNRPGNQHPFPFKYHLQLATSATLPAHADAWSVVWDSQGQVLMSSGSDGVVRMWRKGVAGGGGGGGGGGEEGPNSNSTGGGADATTGEGNEQHHHISAKNVVTAPTNTTTTMAPSTNGGWMLFAEQAVEFADSASAAGGGGTGDGSGEED